MYALLFIFIEAERMQNIVHECWNNLIPNSIISSTKLRKLLKTLAGRISKDNYTLNIGLDSLDQYYKNHFANCKFSPTQIMVTVNTPVKHMHVEYKLFEVFSPFFAFNQETCRTKICRTASWALVLSSQPLCLSYLANQNHKITVKQLSEVCFFACQQTRSLYIVSHR
jgi:hypothetical protein